MHTIAVPGSSQRSQLWLLHHTCRQPLQCVLSKTKVQKVHDEQCGRPGVNRKLVRDVMATTCNCEQITIPTIPCTCIQCMYTCLHLIIHRQPQLMTSIVLHGRTYSVLVMTRATFDVVRHCSSSTTRISPKLAPVIQQVGRKAEKAKKNI